METHFRYRNVFVSIVPVLLMYLLPVSSFCQPVIVVSPVTNQTYQLPDPAVLQTAAQLEKAIVTAETAGKVLEADVTSEKYKAAAKENEYAKAVRMQNDYVAGINNFNKYDVIPYKHDLDNYTATGTKFTGLMASYNKGAMANNALPAKERKAAIVAALNRRKVQIDTMGSHLTKWKIKLDAAKAKLDVKNAALQKQQKKYETAQQLSTANLKAVRLKLNGLLNQLTICANYSGKCHKLLVTKFKAGTSADTGYFASPAYRNMIAGLYAVLVKLRNY